MRAKDLEKDVVISYIRDVEREISAALRKTIPDEITTAALGNVLIRMLVKLKVPKKHFLKKMSDGWDWHETNDD